jgi:protein ImuB
MYAAVALRHVSSENLQQVRAVLAEWTPFWEESFPGIFLLDLRGTEKLWGPPESIAEKLQRSLAGVDIALASSAAIALAIVRGRTGVSIVRAENERQALASLPLQVADPTPEAAEMLAEWGIHTLQDLARLPEDQLCARLGAEGERLHRFACGQWERPLQLRRQQETFDFSYQLDHPLELLEPLFFLLSRALHTIVQRLNAHGLATSSVQLYLQLETGTVLPYSLQLPFASRDVGLLLKLLQLKLSTHPPPSPVVAVAVQCHPTAPRLAQADLFQPPQPEPEKLELTLGRLAAIVGSSNVGSPRLQNSHRPGAFTLDKFSPPKQACSASPPVLHLALRRCRPPLPARVRLVDKRPEWISAVGIRGRVVIWAGPWRSSGNWWGEDAWDCEDWDIELESGLLLRLCCTQNAGWFVEGLYD